MTLYLKDWGALMVAKAKQGELQPFHVLPAVYASQAEISGEINHVVLAHGELVEVPNWSITPGTQRWDLALADQYHAGPMMSSWLAGNLNLFWLS